MRKALAAALCLVLLAASGTALAERTVTLTFVGDCTLGGEDWLINREGSFHDYARKEGYTYFFEKMRDFFSEDDLTIINFEGGCNVGALAQQVGRYFCRDYYAFDS